MTPSKRISTPRSELNGAFLASRLALSSVTSLTNANIPIKRIWFIGDSECILACLEKTNCAFGEYFGNRVGEILDTQAKIERMCPVGKNGEWWHTSSSNNAADQATRSDSVPFDVMPNSRWQQGPEYLRNPTSQWPISRDFSTRKDDCVPSNELLKQFRCLIQKTDSSISFGVERVIDPMCSNSWRRILCMTQNLLQWRYRVHFLGSPASTIQRHTQRLWFLSAMPATNVALKEGRLRELDIRDDNGLKVIQGRASTGMKKFFGEGTLPVIMASTRVAHLIMLDAHYQDHAGKDITLATSRHSAWIVNATKLAKEICKKCLRCRFLRKQLETQKISALPNQVQIPSPPFTNIGIDLLGPIMVKAMVNKRARMKVWVVIFLCLNVKAVSMELAPGYSTSDFLLAFSSHVSQRGEPSFVHSDRGSQLVSAQKNLGDDLPRYDWEYISSSSSRHGTTWKFTPPGAQWRNGATEAFC